MFRVVSRINTKKLTNIDRATPKTHGYSDSFLFQTKPKAKRKKSWKRERTTHDLPLWQPRHSVYPDLSHLRVFNKRWTKIVLHRETEDPRATSAGLEIGTVTDHHLRIQSGTGRSG